MSVPDEAWAMLTGLLPSNDDPDRPQITLSTVAADGGPDARTVLMTEFDADGFYFHTDARSRKVAHIRANPAVAITVLWPGFTSQLVIRGRAEVAPPAEISAAYESRSPYLKQLAWQNSLEFAQLPHDTRVAEWAAFLEEHEDGLAQPDGWIGFLVRPTRLTFWGSNADTASHRIEWELVDGAWTRRELAG